MFSVALFNFPSRFKLFFTFLLFFELLFIYLHYSSPLILYELKGISLIKCV